MCPCFAQVVGEASESTKVTKKRVQKEVKFGPKKQVLLANNFAYHLPNSEKKNTKKNNNCIILNSLKNANRENDISL